ncbi:MAG: hypothetical protein IPJ81_18055 [Chitinophagaceae bacterium]|nr:hypothetical protein [Chitinophagaceae bacterium]
MKKFISIVLVIVGLFSFTNTKAQSATVFPLISADSLNNADTVNKVVTLTAGYEGIVIQPIVTRVSGTAAGTVVLYESLDGTNYKSTGDTLTIANQTTNTVLWKKISPVPVYYKVTGISSGTVVEILRVYYVARKHD